MDMDNISNGWRQYMHDADADQWQSVEKRKALLIIMFLVSGLDC